MELQERTKLDKVESKSCLSHEFDKVIDAMESGHTMPHDESMQMIREKLKEYAV